MTSKNLGQSVDVDVANTLCVMACLFSIILTVMQDSVDISVIAIVSGIAGTIAGSILTITLKSTGAEEKPDPMHDGALHLLETISEEVVIDNDKITIQRDGKSTAIRKCGVNKRRDKDGLEVSSLSSSLSNEE